MPKNNPIKPPPIFNPHVLARRSFHKKTVAWSKKPLSNLLGWFGLFGLVFLLLPVCIKPWRAVVEHAPILSHIFDFYVKTRQGAYFIRYLAGFLMVFKLIAYKCYPNVDKVFGTRNPSPDDLYPHTKKEEVGFLFNVCFQIGVASIFIYFPFGMIAFFIIK